MSSIWCCVGTVFYSLGKQTLGANSHLEHLLEKSTALEMVIYMQEYF